MRLTALAWIALAACNSDKGGAPSLSADDRKTVAGVTKQCIEAVATLAPGYQAVGPKLANALKLDRAQAQSLLRDSIELLISTREMVCNASLGIVDAKLVKVPSDPDAIAAKGRVDAALTTLANARSAYDALLGAASSATAPVDEAALLQRLSSALTAPP